MSNEKVLIIDDEKNIRLTLSQAISSLPVEVDTAEDGEQALQMVKEGEFGVILLDLRLPGIDGMEVLRRLRDSRPEVPIVIITAHGNVESAVEAMKLGAIDFLQKPFVPDEVRALVRRVLGRRTLEQREAADYASRFNLAKRCLTERRFDAALEHVKQAIGIDPERPEAFNLLGVIHELCGERKQAVDNYRVACHVDGSYQPAADNLHRATSMHPRQGAIIAGELREDLERGNDSDD